MNAELGEDARLEPVLAGLLRYGTWVASAVTAAGVALALVGDRSGGKAFALRVVSAGCACFILLPILRVLAMLIAYLRERDYRFVAITATVLLIILTGIALGTHMAKAQ